MSPFLIALTYWFLLTLSVLCGLFALTNMVIWVSQLRQAFRLYSQHRLYKRHRSPLIVTGMATSMAVGFTPFFYTFIYLDMNRHDTIPTMIEVITTAVLTLLLLALWLCTWLLYVLPVQPDPPIYLYELPTEADLVRLEKCMLAIALVLKDPASPIIENPEILEAVVRATEVSTRAQVLPPGKKGVQLTNDFGVYCQIAIEAFTAGYYGMLARCQQDPALPEHLTALPEEEADQEIERLALSILMQN